MEFGFGNVESGKLKKRAAPKEKVKDRGWEGERHRSREVRRAKVSKSGIRVGASAPEGRQK
jgi:hypothetical protein